MQNLREMCFFQPTRSEFFLGHSTGGKNWDWQKLGFFGPRALSQKPATPHKLQKWDRTGTPPPMTDIGHFLANNHHIKNTIDMKYVPGPRAQYG